MRSQKKNEVIQVRCAEVNQGNNRKHRQSERNQTKRVDLLCSFIPAFPSLVTTCEHTDMCGRAPVRHSAALSTSH